MIAQSLRRSYHLLDEFPRTLDAYSIIAGQFPRNGSQGRAPTRHFPRRAWFTSQFSGSPR